MIRRFKPNANPDKIVLVFANKKGNDEFVMALVRTKRIKDPISITTKLSFGAGYK